MRISVMVAAVSVFSALSAVLTYFTRVPSPTGGYTHVGDSAIYIAALVFGFRAGLPVGLIGPVIVDLVTGYPRWYVTPLAHGIQGLIAGLGRGKPTWLQTVIIFSSGVAMSLTYFAVNIFVKGLAPAVVSLVRDVFGQTLVSVVIAVPIVKAVERSGVLKTFGVE